jgi:hypothetical protein
MDAPVGIRGVQSIQRDKERDAAAMGEAEANRIALEMRNAREAAEGGGSASSSPSLGLALPRPHKDGDAAADPNAPEALPPWMREGAGGKSKQGSIAQIGLDEFRENREDKKMSAEAIKTKKMGTVFTRARARTDAHHMRGFRRTQGRVALHTHRTCWSEPRLIL